jgi:AraC-like DNA-binding protein
VHALEAASSWTPQRRFAYAVSHAIDGHLPYERYQEAGRARRKAKAGAGTVERLIQEWLSTDLNPAVQFFRSQTVIVKALHCFNVYNSTVNLAVRTTATSQSHSSNSSSVIFNRNVVSANEDPEPCRLGTYFVFNSVIDIVARNQLEGLTPIIYSLSDIAANLGVAYSASAEVAMVFELEGHIPVGQVARRVGCHQRTLERRLREEGLTAEAIRMASRLIRATKRLRSSDNLTIIAMEEGFSDQAHMTRVFRSSCGMTPSMLRNTA